MITELLKDGITPKVLKDDIESRRQRYQESIEGAKSWAARINPRFAFKDKSEGLPTHAIRLFTAYVIPVAPISGAGNVLYELGKAGVQRIGINLAERRNRRALQNAKGTQGR